MIDVKISLTVALPGGVMVSKQACLKNAKNNNSNLNEKQLETLFTVECCDTHTLFVTNDKREREKIVYHTRKSKPALQVIQLSRDAYNYFVGDEAPAGYLPDLQYSKARDRSWKQALTEFKIVWHLQRIAESLGGQIKEFTVFED